MKLFIDTNIYLNYFRSSDESLSSLEELKKLLKRKRLKLVLPIQTRDEYFRNRNGIAEQSRELLLRETKLKLILPTPFLRSWQEATHIRKQVKATQKAYQRLLQKYDAEVAEEKTRADILIKSLFKTAEMFEDDEELLRKAHFRYLRGHPPKKNDGSLGDAIAWELLLAKTEDDLVLVSKDGDFAEQRGGVTWLKGFLEKEWRSKCGGKTIKLHDSLGEFINTFEKRQAVKEEVIKKEKYPENPWPLNPVFANLMGAGFNRGTNTVFADSRSSGALLSGANRTILTPIASGTVFSLGRDFINGSSAILGGTPGEGGTISANWNAGDYVPSPLFNRRMKFCPFCGNDIEAALSSGPIPIMIGFTCPQCNSQFDPRIA